MRAASLAPLPSFLVPALPALPAFALTFLNPTSHLQPSHTSHTFHTSQSLLSKTSFTTCRVIQYQCVAQTADLPDRRISTVEMMKGSANLSSRVCVRYNMHHRLTITDSTSSSSLPKLRWSPVTITVAVTATASTITAMLETSMYGRTSSGKPWHDVVEQDSCS